MITYYFDSINHEYVIERNNIEIFRTQDEVEFYQVLDDLLS